MGDCFRSGSRVPQLAFSEDKVYKRWSRTNKVAVLTSYIHKYLTLCYNLLIYKQNLTVPSPGGANIIFWFDMIGRKLLRKMIYLRRIRGDPRKTHRPSLSPSITGTPPGHLSQWVSLRAEHAATALGYRESNTLHAQPSNDIVPKISLFEPLQQLHWNTLLNIIKLWCVVGKCCICPSEME